LKNGCTWRDLPADYPKWSTVYYYWMSWSKAPTPDKPALLTQVLKKLSLIDD
ncbi:transposase, partial [Lactobacillus rhamnosus]|nr:transposase [Lacticaseibacillus rhamnosus]